VARAQQKPTELDKSPMDMSYLPSDYPILKMAGKTKGQPIARVIYGRPQKNGREIFGGIIKYGEVWRFGANEATEIEFFRNVKLGNKPIAKGRYTLFCIPNADKWTLILNKELFAWGSFTYDAKKDVVRIDATPEIINEVIDPFTIYFEETKNTDYIVIVWDNVRTKFPFTIEVK
jgi:hypothetical protein